MLIHCVEELKSLMWNLLAHLLKRDRNAFHVQSVREHTFHVQSVREHTFHVQSVREHTFHVQSVREHTFHVQSVREHTFHVQSVREYTFHVQSVREHTFQILLCIILFPFKLFNDQKEQFGNKFTPNKFIPNGIKLAKKNNVPSKFSSGFFPLMS
jgi:hypothetical protein